MWVRFEKHFNFKKHGGTIKSIKNKELGHCPLEKSDKSVWTLCTVNVQLHKQFAYHSRIFLQSLWNTPKDTLGGLPVYKPCGPGV